MTPTNPKHPRQLEAGLKTYSERNPGHVKEDDYPTLKMVARKHQRRVEDLERLEQRIGRPLTLEELRYAMKPSVGARRWDAWLRERLG